MKQPCVYIITNQKNGTLYIGVTSNLLQRIQQHKEKTIKGFTTKYSLDKLIWYETHDTMYTAISREKAMKEWKREWKIKLIEKDNPEWRDLYDGLF